jgi:hypothetical protein
VVQRAARLGVVLAVLASIAVTTSVAVAGPNDPTVLFGAYAQPVGVSQRVALEDWEATAGRRAEVVREYLTWDEEFPTDYHEWLAATGRVPMISLNTRGNNSYDWADVAATRPGDQLYGEIVEWAGRFRDYSVPFYFTFHHEPETSNNLGFGTNEEFIAAWRNVIEIFRSEGVDNAEFLWITTSWAYGVAQTDRRYAPEWYPGDAWVDQLGADAYNWHDCANPNNTNWRPMAEVIEGFRQFGSQHPDSSLVIPEYGTVEDSDFPNRKAEWFQDAQALFKQPGYEQFTAMLYFNALRAVGCEWAIDSSPQTLAAFRALGADVYYSATGIPGTAGPLGITVDVTADPSSVTEPGGLVAFDVTVANRSPEHPVDLAALDDAVVGSLDGVGTCAVPQRIDPGGAYACRYQVEVVGTAGGIYTATVAAQGTSDNTPVADQHVASVSIVAERTGEVLFVVDDASSPTAGESVVASRLESLGYATRLITGAASTASDAAGTDAVLISSSVAEAAVGDEFRDVTQPVIIWKPWLYDAMDLSATNGNSTTATTLDITDPTHPLAAGFSGAVSVLSPASRMARGAPGGEGHTVATVGGVPALFVYEPGARLADGSISTGCRIAYPLHTNTAVDLTVDGWAVFDNAVAWAADSCVVVPPEPTAPGAPTGVSAVAGDGAATVSWSAPADDGGSPLVGFTVTSSPDSIVVTAGPGASSVLVTGLTNGVAYTFTVVASNAEGNSVPSEPSNEVTPEVPAVPDAVLFVVANTGLPTVGDQAVADRLDALGFDVLIIGASAAAAADADGKALVVISSNVSTTALGTKFEDVPQPVIIYKPWAYDAMEMTPGNGASTTVTAVDIIDPAHPLAAGLTGTVSIVTTDQRVATGVPAGGAAVIATANGAATLFAFSTGATMDDGTPAEGCRIGFPAFHETPAFYTADGWLLFDTAVHWSTTGCGG